MTETPVPSQLRTDENHVVLAALAPLSAHSDVAEVLMRSLESVAGVEFYCPDWQTYRYVVAHRNGIVFGFAIGMKMIGLRLAGSDLRAAQAEGASAVEGLSDGWVGFTLFDPSRPEPDVEGFLRRAAALT